MKDERPRRRTIKDQVRSVCVLLVKCFCGDAKGRKCCNMLGKVFQMIVKFVKSF